MKPRLIVLILILNAFSCKNTKQVQVLSSESEVPGSIRIKGILNNKTGLSGCGWVIKLAVKDAHSHEYLEPLNLDKFKIELIDGKEVELTYVEENANSGCMIGTIVSLKSINEIK